MLNCSIMNGLLVNITTQKIIEDIIYVLEVLGSASEVLGLPTPENLEDFFTISLRFLKDYA